MQVMEKYGHFGSIYCCVQQQCVSKLLGAPEMEQDTTSGLFGNGGERAREATGEHLLPAGGPSPPVTLFLLSV